uniref:Uncharacterized protein n=1 Tax=Arundo donax TaxID=35708 RepID=A0A0A8ZP76_ARUDO
MCPGFYKKHKHYSKREFQHHKGVSICDSNHKNMK